MGLKGFIKPSRQAVLALALVAMCAPLPSYAQETTISRDQLMGLAKQFVDKVGKNLKTAEELLAEKINPEDLRMQKYFDALADGEILVMQIILQSTKKSEYVNLNIDQPVLGIKEGSDVMVSLTDFISAAGFPIKLDPAKGTGKGWFIREKNTFDLDLANVSLRVEGQPVAIEKGDVQLGDDDILVKGKALARWFRFQLVVNPRSQSLRVTTTEKWPAQEKIDRMKRFAGKRKLNKPKQPFVESPYDSASIPNIGVNLRQNYIKPKNGQAVTNTGYSVQGTGDLIGHSVNTSISGTQETPVDNVTLNFSKESDRPELLGVLKAREYEFADIRSVSVPFTGTSPIERGVRVSNRNPFSTLDTVTGIEGFSQPGWDVEIYRDVQYLDGTTVDENGRYLFENIPLFVGDNTFRIVQYGPQGEYIEDQRVISVTPGSYAGEAGIYNVSISQQNTITYTAVSSNDPDEGTPHIAGTYEHRLKSGVILRGGVLARQQQGEEIVYLYNGAVTVLNNTVFNYDSVITSASTFKSILTARRNFGKHTGSLVGEFKSEGFVTDTSTTRDAPAQISARGQLRGPVYLNGSKIPATYDTYAGLYARDNGNTGYSAGLTLSTRYRTLGISNALTYSQETAGTNSGFDSQTFLGRLSVRGRALGGAWRTDLGYSILPVFEMTDLDLNFRKDLTPTLDAELDIQNDIPTGYSLVNALLNWRYDLATISPSVSYDSDETMTARLNVRFGLAYDPYSSQIVMKGRSFSERGNVSTFVFLDKGGDGFFTEGDEPLQDVIVEASQVQKSATSDASGEAFIYDLPANRTTDIVMQENSAFDPNWVSGFAGVSVRPRPGHTDRFEFPVLRGAEMDGTAYLVDKDGRRVEARNIDLVITAPDGTIEQVANAPYDGFYVFSAIRPGVYYITASTANSTYDAFLPPKKLVITAEGGTFYGRNLTLYRGYNVPITFRSTNAAPMGKKGARVVKPTDIVSEETLIHLGQYRSKLAMTLAWYKFKFRTETWGGFFTLDKPLSDIKPDPKTALMTLNLRPSRPLSVEEASSVCQDLIDKEYTCGIDVITTYQDYSKLVAEENLKILTPASYKPPEKKPEDAPASDEGAQNTNVLTPEDTLEIPQENQES